MGANQPLSGQQLKQLTEAILAGFNRNDLEELLLLDLDVRLEHITGNDDLRKTVKDILDWAQKYERVGDLIQAMKRARPKSAAIAALAQMAAGQASTPPPAQETGPQLSATLALKMAYVPTAIIHLLKPDEFPVVQVELTNTASRPRHLRVISVVEDYSKTVVAPVDLDAAGSAGATAKVLQQPVFTRNALREINEQLLAVIRTQVEDLDVQRTILDTTPRIWMLPINSAPVRVKDEATGAVRDMLPYLGAFVTKNEKSTIQPYLTTVAAFHSKKQLAGYYAADSAGDSVRSQVRALTAALKQENKLSYATAIVETIADSAYQRVRLPRECLMNGQANCLEGVLLYCSLLEAMGLQSAIVWAREHAVVAWLENPAKPTQWSFLDPTKVANGTFETAMKWGATIFEDNKDKGPEAFRILPIRDLRAQGITPLE